ncbi:uncharacterized protein LOC110855091 isoform X2 [Folsomia candida]|uniref:uncharacterized protein LOC110855091 isoform X2 n=1 Tax=Folsomia candida TaxID=158441 RepID=UPI000B8FC8D5|nr:uncharacterized protein LOC110855091 isoform X2 [Folsomia candida]
MLTLVLLVYLLSSSLGSPLPSGSTDQIRISTPPYGKQDLEANEDALNNLKTRVQPEFILQSRTDLRKSRQMSNMPFIIYGGCSPYNGFAQAGLQTRASQPFNPLQLATFFANLPPQLQNLIRLLAVSAPTLLQYAGR